MGTYSINCNSNFSDIYNMTILFPFIHTYTYTHSQAHTQTHTHVCAHCHTLNNIDFAVNFYLWIIQQPFLSQARNYFRVIDIKGRNRRLNGQNCEEGSCCLCSALILSHGVINPQKRALL
jgi:hypothetical protein